MSGLYVHRSNVMEGLVGALVAVLDRPGPDPWRPEVIVVQGRGMERWLSMRLAKAFGVWGNADHPFPRAFVQRLLDATTGELDSDPYARLSLTFALAEELRRRPAPPVERFIRGDDRRRFTLAARLADLYDRYLVYRPEWMVHGFPDPGHWQAELWGRIVELLGPRHFAERHRLARHALQRSPHPALPLRVSIFGVTTLPPAYSSLLRAFASHAEVHFFVQSPSREYWGDSQRQLGIFTGNEGPPLLEVLGKHARQFHELLEELGYAPGAEAYREPAPEICCTPCNPTFYTFVGAAGRMDPSPSP